MSKSTYYIVQTAPMLYIHNDGVVFPFTEYPDERDATQFRTLCDAIKVWRKACKVHAGGGRRYPRIIKITTEAKTVKDRR